MPNGDRTYELHEISDFPFVYASEREREPGTAEQWQWEMGRLIARGEAFVIIFPPNLHDDVQQTDEQKRLTQEGRKLRAVWLKENRRALAAVCKGLISIQENRVKRALEAAKSAMLEKAFGVPFKVAASRAEAEKLGRTLVGPLHSGIA